MIYNSVYWWRERLGIKVGMTKEQALDKFIQWRSNKKTCQRCEGEKYKEYCDIHLICEEADNVARNDNGRGVMQNTEHQTLRIGLFEKRKRTTSR